MSKCKFCKKEYTKSEFASSFEKWCSIDCAISLAKKKGTHQAKLKIARDADKRHREFKRVVNGADRSRQLSLTQTAFNKLRRLQELKWFKDRNLEPECISCGKKNMDWCCGHLKTVGSHPELRFSEANTKLQCNRYCNMGLSGNINGNKTTRGYLVGLVDRFGKDEASRIIKELSVDVVRKLDCAELIKMRKAFNAEIREIYKYDCI